MTREEAIKYFESWAQCNYAPTRDAALMALTALTPPTQEQMERVWPGCEACKGDKTIKSDNFCGAATLRIIGDSIDLHGNDKKIKFFRHIYAPSFSIKFCPYCGRPLTQEAWVELKNRLEVLGDDKG